MDAIPVVAYGQTQPVGSAEDAADDPAIWVHPASPESSIVIGTDKNQKTGGLYLYDLKGALISFTPEPGVNNVDVRQNVLLPDSTRVDVVAASRRSDNSIALYALDPSTRKLHSLEDKRIQIQETYGGCLSLSQGTGALYFYSTSKSGQVEQWQIDISTSRIASGKLIGRFAVATQTEGCVVDDELGIFWLGEEDRGIWKFPSEPDPREMRSTDYARPGILVDSVGGGHLAADVEGLALYLRPDGQGFLVASSQGDNTYAIYNRQHPHRHIANIRIAANDSIGSAEETDGIEVSSAPLGDGLPQGILIVQDGHNPPHTQNFKLVDWRAVPIPLVPLTQPETDQMLP